MLKVGLTGGIGSGKSMAAGFFRELGCPVLDLDQVSRDITRPDSPALKEIAIAFGNDLIGAEGTLNRGRLGEIVFGDETNRRRLEAILHPRIREESDRWVAEQRRNPKPSPLVMIEIPLLFESKLENSVDRIVLITADAAVRVARLRERRGLEESAARARIAAQLPEEWKAARSHYVIHNNSTPEALQQQVRKVWDALCGEA